VPAQLELSTTSAGAAGAAVRVIVTPDGNVLINNTTGTERLSVTGNIQLTATADSYMVGTNNVVGSRKTGWAAPTGTATRTTFDTTTVTTEQLAERVKALIDDLTSHGLIGA
jgi:flagellar basal body rod protein FlgF